jgi:hypothetical protein
MKQLLNLIFWRLTLCTLCILGVSKDLCDGHGYPKDLCDGHGKSVSYIGNQMCFCDDGWMPSGRFTYVNLPDVECGAYIGSDCSRPGPHI